MRVPFSDEEKHLRDRIILFTKKGRPKDALRYYDQEDVFVQSASTHFLAFAAACDCGKSDEYLDAIFKKALRCRDFDRSELNFDRERAVKLATSRPVRRRNAKEALAAINEVLRSRSDDEGQDRAQLPIDKLARYKILVYAGGAFTAKGGLQRLAARQSLPIKAKLDAEWWYLVSLVMTWEHRQATKTAWQPNRDSKPKRKAVRYLVRVPLVGPILARIVLKQLMGL